ncbi:MAG TPA: hypothetical protein VN648_13855 [Candidatus Methylomirabilis sp.]|nr:hypothetical protein [Candidatus Methylomirabilis sp.]
MGCATPDPAFPFAVTIYYGRIHDLARTWTGTEDEILGPVIAHEMGHLFLGFSGHSSSGVMSGRWDSSLFKLAQVEQLRFSRQEVAAIQANVARRIQAAIAQLTAQSQAEKPEAQSARTSAPTKP